MEVLVQPWLWVWLLVFPLLLAIATLVPVLGAKAPRG
jgi:ABC-type transporter Mla maintaining outer membrane lipid asymmetry permease subunit MlaE